MKKAILFIAILMPLNLFADQWKILGTRPMGMGGAFVAIAQGPLAQYWNPAGLAQKSTGNVSGFEIPVGAGLEMTGGIMKNASEIGDLSNELDAIKASQDGSGKVDAQSISAFVKTLSLLEDMNKPGKGALLETAAGVDFKFSKISISVNNYTNVGLNPYIDTKNIGIQVDNTSSSLGNNIPSNTTDPGSAYAPAITNLTQAIDNIGGITNIQKLLCGLDSSGNLNSCLPSGMTNSTAFATAIVNEAITAGVTPEKITEASQDALKYSSEAKPIVDALASQTSYKENQSSLNLKAGSFTEVSFGYGRYFNKWLSGLAVGANLKAVNGIIANQTFKFMEDDDTKNATDDIFDNTKSSWKPAMDIGFLWEVNDKYPKIPMRPRVGLVIRNINSPKFDGPNDTSYKLDRQARLGLAISPFNFWHFAMDMDITKNKTAVEGYDSRQFAFGTEINIINRKAFNIPLRAGISKNLAESSSKTAYSLGTGINLLFMHFDVSAQMSSDKTEIDGTKYPNKLMLSASFGLLF
ncbi:MAG: hypothetical protein A4E27_01761 [Methanobacterium sp. PtaU1.Bin242]|nr:MAG: hypothetical protein A4E27_01761 [Methanobacterium sp. PtaU1.Bin242]